MRKEIIVKRIISLVGAGLLVLLTGCSQIASAASVGSKSISIASIQKGVDSVLAERAKVDTSTMQLVSGPALATSELRFQLIAILLADVANQKGIVVTPAEIAAKRASVVAQVGGESSLPKALVSATIAPKDLIVYLNSVLYSDKLSALAIKNGATASTAGTAIQAMVVAYTSIHKVIINPRYGKWDDAKANIVASDATSGAVK
jgi:hypothetical protein